MTAFPSDPIILETPMPAAVTPQTTGTIAGDEAMVNAFKVAFHQKADEFRGGTLPGFDYDEAVRIGLSAAFATTAATPPAVDVTGEAGEDLVTRLRTTDLLYNRGPHYEPLRCEPSELRLEAAREIERLRAATRPAASGDGGGEVDLADLNRMFANIPAGPYSADARGNGWEVRAIDTDPTNKHHWPYRLCASIPGQQAGCDPDVFGFIAGVINAWPQIAVTRPLAAQGEVEKVQEAFSWAKKRVAEAQALQAQIDRLTKERDEARTQFDAHDELLHQCLDDRDAYRQRAIKSEAERDEATHTLEFVEKHLTARLEAAEASLASMTAERDRLREALEGLHEAMTNMELGEADMRLAIKDARAALASPQADAGSALSKEHSA